MQYTSWKNFDVNCFPLSAVYRLGRFEVPFPGSLVGGRAG